jgi:hypothetical protein
MHTDLDRKVEYVMKYAEEIKEEIAMFDNKLVQVTLKFKEKAD